ncbi:MAG: homocitrate synthase [Spirulinaceae cyanobacterium RM2_2_10]|nr:homocitrate synthase [Spirulinaceae cyanobacterium SM2_1_0]NJO20942.1 homocitrate synthase [Spirulinaceae cyanobacterium RM2_2_10]
MSLTQFAIIDSTLREGEQFASAHFSTADKIEIAESLDFLGVEYIEVTSPCASPQSRQDCQALANRDLSAKLLTHIRCHLDDAKVALDTGVDGINLVIGTSAMLRQFSHGKSIDQIIDMAATVLGYIREQAPALELRFSTEDSFRSDRQELLKVYGAVEQLGIVQRFGMADTVGISTPLQVMEMVRDLRRVTQADIEFHCHNDTGCAIANSYVALEAGATHIDTTIMGIGERNGITSLAGLIARLYASDPDGLRDKYRLHQLIYLHQLVSRKVGVAVPFDHCIVGESAFRHKAGIHTKAVLKNPATYEAINPQDFACSRSIAIGHRLTGWHAIAHRAQELGLNLDEAQLRASTQAIKALADTQELTLEDVDRVLLQSVH